MRRIDEDADAAQPLSVAEMQVRCLFFLGWAIG
jgi:hypothetical protein